MKNEEIQIGIKEIQKIKMSQNEKENILKNVLNFSIPKKEPIRSPYSFFSIFQKNHFVLYGAMSVFIIFLGSGGIILGSQKSLPGNALYPLKVKVIEPLNSVFKLSPTEKARYEISLVKERVVEAETLASRGDLDVIKEQQVNDLIESHKIAFNNAIDEMKQNEPSEQIVSMTNTFENQMQEQTETLAIVVEPTNEIAQVDDNSQNQEIAMVNPEKIETFSENKNMNNEKTTQNTENKESPIISTPETGVSSAAPAYVEIPPSAEIKNNDNDSQKYIEISLPLFTEWFKQIATDRGDVLNYQINEINFIASKENTNNNENSPFGFNESNNAFIVSINYSVQTTPEGKNNYWLAGNGIDSSDGWILNKSIFITIDKENGKFYIKNTGTGL